MENNAYGNFIHPTSEDRELLDRLARGEIKAYEQLFLRYYPTFLTFVRGMLKDAFAAEDITQNIFLKVWINRDRLDPAKSIRSYLFVLAKHEVYNQLRTRSRSFTPLQEVDRKSQDDAGASFPSGNEIEQMIDLRETSERIDAVIAAMPPKRQEVFRLSRFEHLSNREISERLNLSVRTVDKHLELAIRELRQHIHLLPALIVFFDLLP